MSDKRDRESLTGQAREILLSITAPQSLAELAKRHELTTGVFTAAANQLVSDRALVSWIEGMKRGRKRIVAPAGWEVPASATSPRAAKPARTPASSAPGFVAAAITLLEARDLDDKTARAAALSLLRKHT